MGDQPKPRALVLIILFFTAASFLSTMPLIITFLEDYPGSPNDNDLRFNIWIIHWGYHALTTQPLELHQANMFHPEKNTFAYSEIELSHSLLMAPFIAALAEPEVVFNILLLLSPIIGGVGYYLLFFRFTRLHSAAVAGALIAQFSAPLFGRYTQMHLFGGHWLPWTLLLLWHWLDSEALRGKWLAAAATAVFFCLQALSGSHNAIFIMLITGVAGIHLVIRHAHWKSWQLYAQGAGACLLILIVLIPVFLPYFTLGEEMASQRLPDESYLKIGSAGLTEFLHSGSHFYRWLREETGWPTSFTGEAARGSLWPGLIAIILALMAFFHSGRARIGKLHPGRLSFALDAFVLLTLVLLITTLFSPLASPRHWSSYFTSFEFMIALLALIAVAVRWLFARKDRHLLLSCISWIRENAVLPKGIGVWLILLLLAAFLAMGPNGLLYNFMAGIPGVQLIRVPRRFFIIGIAALGALSAYGVARMHARSTNKKNYLAALILLLTLFAAESSFAPLPLFPIEEPHPLYQWIGEKPGTFTVLEYPVNASGHAEAIRQVYGSIHHWKDLIVGYSGFQTEENIALQQFINQGFPEPPVLEKLAELNTRYICVFLDRIEEARRMAIDESVRAGRLSAVKEFGTMTVYELSSWRE